MYYGNFSVLNNLNVASAPFDSFECRILQAANSMPKGLLPPLSTDNIPHWHTERYAMMFEIFTHRA